MTQVFNYFGESAMGQDLGAFSYDLADPEPADNKSLASKQSQTSLISRASSFKPKTISDLMSLKQDEVKLLEAPQDTIANIPAPVVTFLKQAGAGEKILTDTGKLRSGNNPVAKAAQRMRRQLGRIVRKAKTDPDYVKKIERAIEKKYGSAQNILLDDPISKMTNPDSIDWQQSDFGGGRAKFFKVGKIQNPQGLKILSYSNFSSKFPQEKTYNLNQQFAPVPSSLTTKRAAKITNLQSYINTLNTGRLNKDDPFWSQIDSKLVKWNKNMYQINDPQLDKKFRSFVTSMDRANWNLNTANILMSKKLDSAQVEAAVPALVKQIVAANSVYSVAGIGPISKTSLPFYAGRWIDKATGRVRVLPNPTTKYINPLSFAAKVQYLQARILNSWNKFVSASDQYYTMLSKKPEEWEKRQKARLKAQLQGNVKNMVSAAKWMASQIKSYQMGIPVSNSTRIVLGTSEQIGKNKQIEKSVDKLVGLGDGIKKTDIETFAAELQKIAETVIGKITGQTQADIQKKLKIARAYGTWMEKGLERNADALKKLMRSFIPMNLEPSQLVKVDQKIKEWDEIFSKANITMTGSNVDKYLAIKPYASLEQYTKGLDSMKGDVLSSNKIYSQRYVPKKTKTIQKQDKLWKKVQRPGLKLADL